MNDDEIRSAVAGVLADVVPEVDPASLDPAASFRDQVEMDSVDFLNFVLALEKTLGTHVPEVDYPKLASLDGAAEYLARATAEATGDAGRAP